jgi:hypothetical protein
MKQFSRTLAGILLLSIATSGFAKEKRKPAQAVEELSAEEIKLVQKMRQTYRAEEGQNASPELRDRMQSEVGYNNEAQRNTDLRYIEDNLHRLSDKKARHLRQALDKMLQ